MKLFVITCLLFAAFVRAQEEETPPPLTETFTSTEETATDQPVGQCYVGEVVNGEPLGNITQFDCDFDAGKACQTKIETRVKDDGEVTFQFVVRICTQMVSCENNAKENSRKCFPGENNVRQCFFCCDKDLCNTNLEIIEEEVEEENEEE